MARVALVKESDCVQAVRKALELLSEPLPEVAAGKEVLIKVNLAVAASPESGATCDPRVALALGAGYIFPRARIHPHCISHLDEEGGSDAESGLQSYGLGGGGGGVAPEAGLGLDDPQVHGGR